MTAQALELDRQQCELDVLGGLSYRAGNLGAYLREIANAVAALVRVDWVAITLCRSGHEQVLASTLSLSPAQTTKSVHGEVTETVVRTGSVVVVEDIERDGSHGTMPFGYRAYLGVPLCTSRGEVLGTVCSFACRPRRFGEEDVRAAMLFAERAATSIDNYQLYEEPCAANAKLERQVQARNEFLSIASHELRTPVTSLMLMAQGLRSRKMASNPEKVLRAADLFARQVERLKGLTDELLCVGRIDVGHLEMNLSRMDLAALVRDELERFAPIFRKARCSVTLRGDESLLGWWDYDKVAQVVANLLTNAAKFGAGKPIEIAVEKLPDAARLIVVDHGVGIDAQALPRIFEKFERAASSRSYGGLGLGLYIVRNIVEALGGRVRAESTPNVETKLTVELPVGNKQA